MREIGRNEAGGSRRSSILWIGINRGRLPDGRKGMQRTRKIEDVMKNYTGTRECRLAESVAPGKARRRERRKTRTSNKLSVKCNELLPGLGERDEHVLCRPWPWPLLLRTKYA